MTRIVPSLLAACISLAALATRSTAANYPDPLQLTGDFVYVHDPSLIQRASDGKYFLFTSHNKAGIITADNLAGPWTEVGSILPDDSVIDLPGRDDIWAPDVSFHNGQYYAYYAVSVSGSQNSAIGLATSPTMEPGTWTDKGQVFRTQTGDPYNAIDPNLIIDENGVPLLTFGSYWGDIYQFNLANDFQTMASSPVQVAHNSTPPSPVEGSFVWKHDDFYYLFTSSGQCCSFDPNNLPPPGNEYKVFVGRSSSAHGPFLDQNGVDMVDNGGTLVIASHGDVFAPGGEGVFTDSKSGKDIFVYHYLHSQGSIAYLEANASLGLNAIDWSSGWPVLTSI
ncbi:glycoside hydrolase family 43 protein [Trametes coccinea BRFM310]|uniref:Arabinan endo-1,5-alpha-L-arabinosidase n=1 Tax=Trametes coccinea (strain BRFM310) TaxID=1353009 RepID=A0A1Y2IQL0_TRAC3|nr:glycoside hydrolase family 43 protein [Trametes coccinea BRFM310]